MFYHIIDNPSSLTNKFALNCFNRCCTLYLEEKRRILQFPNTKQMILNAQRIFLGNIRVCLKQIAEKSKIEGKEFAIKEIKQIANNKTFREVLEIYPYWKNPIKQAITSFLLLKRMYLILYFLLRLFNS